ncbi:MAG: hypothetical protein ACXQTW_07685 [Candidatus Methanospirareceae archaeon]
MEEKEKIWAWLMPSGKIYKVVTKPAEGTIKVYDGDRKLVNKEEKLSEEAVSLIEKNFLEIVAAKVRGKGTENEDNLEIAMYIR